MGRCLIVANQTLGGEALDRSVRDCINRDVNVFYVVVPMTEVKDESETWSGGFGVYDNMSSDQIRAFQQAAARDHEAAVAEARRRTRQRLDQMIEKIQTAGGQAEGEIGVDDPLEATKEVLERHEAFDEIIVSTLPAGLSRWVKMDVPHRIARLTDVPVTTVEAEADPGQGGP
jgi:nucleotide-binding universal stress UspA family protein